MFPHSQLRFLQLHRPLRSAAALESRRQGVLRESGRGSLHSWLQLLLPHLLRCSPFARLRVEASVAIAAVEDVRRDDEEHPGRVHGVHALLSAHHHRVFLGRRRLEQLEHRRQHRVQPGQRRLGRVHQGAHVGVLRVLAAGVAELHVGVAGEELPRHEEYVLCVRSAATADPFLADRSVELHFLCASVLWGSD